MNDGNISTNTMNEAESMSDNEKGSYIPEQSTQTTQYNVVCIK